MLNVHPAIGSRRPVLSTVGCWLCPRRRQVGMGHGTLRSRAVPPLAPVPQLRGNPSTARGGHAPLCPRPRPCFDGRTSPGTPRRTAFHNLAANPARARALRSHTSRGTHARPHARPHSRCAVRACACARAAGPGPAPPPSPLAPGDRRTARAWFPLSPRLCACAGFPRRAWGARALYSGSAPVCGPAAPRLLWGLDRGAWRPGHG